ncbi:MAG: LysR substrate-binding domain-containing protein [Bradyrhizobium sp.]
MPTTLDIDTLRSLVAIADMKSFSRVAERLGRSQSAISLRIARLEVLVGHSVIERARGRVIGLTPRGERLVEHARQIIELNERAVASVRQPASGAHIKVGMPADFLERDFPLILQKIHSRHPAANLEVRSDLSARLIRDVDDGRLDLAFFKRLPSSDVGSPIGSETLRWFRGATARFATGGTSSPFPLVAFGEGCAYRQEAVRGLRQAGRNWYLACEARSFPALAAAVEAGLGYAALPARLGERKSLVVVHPKGLPKLEPVELAVNIASGRDAPLIRSIAGIIAQHCTVV